MAKRKIKLNKLKSFTEDDIEKNKKIYDEYYDIRMVKGMNEHIFNLMEQNYFRPKYIGLNDLPERDGDGPPIIFAGNHSGMAFPWDAMVFGCGMFRIHNYNEKKLFRPLSAPMLSGMPYMHPYFMLHAWKVAGSIDASFINFETMMRYPKGHLLIYPEGVPGIGKGFNRKYKLQRFASSFIKMSIKYKADIIWFSTVNAEYVAPYMYSNNAVNKFFNKLGIPFLPLGPLTLMLLFPFAFYLSFPANMHFVKGRKFKPYEMTDKSYDELSEVEIFEIRDKVQAMCQEDLNAAVREYGKKPYDFKSLFKVLFRKFPYNTPLGWPFLFHEYERQWYRHRETGKEIKLYNGWGSVFIFMFKNPITLAYFLPIIGWIILIIYGNIKWKNSNKYYRVL